MYLEPSKESPKPKLLSRIKSRLRLKRPQSKPAADVKPTVGVKPKSGVSGWFKKRSLELGAKPTEPASIRWFTFGLTLVSIMLILTFVPFFPQPVPILIAVLIAFIVFLNPMIGMVAGGIPIFLSLSYHLSTINFIAGLGSSMVRAIIVGASIFSYIMLPILFRRYEDAVAIDIGIIAACMLFFDSTYFLAFPLLLTAALFFKKTQIGLSTAYYVLISAPLLSELYFQFVNNPLPGGGYQPLPGPAFYNNPGALPPLFRSLSSLIAQMQVTMTHVRLFELSQSLTVISGQIFARPVAAPFSLSEIIIEYLDSLAGIIFFFVILIGTVFTVMFLLRSLTKGSIGKMERVIPVLAAMGITSLYFVFLVFLHKPLAFEVDIDTTMIVEGVFASGLFALPFAVANFVPRTKAVIEKRSLVAVKKSQDLLTKVAATEDLLQKIKDTIPVNVQPQTGKKDVLKDRLNVILTKAQTKAYKLPELETRIKELDSTLPKSLEDINAELDDVLKKYQLNSNYQYIALVRNLKELGYEVQNPIATGFQKDQPPEQRIETIRQVVNAGRAVGIEVNQLSEGIYRSLQSLYDPLLPPESGTLTYVAQRLKQKTAPWPAMNALMASLNTWDRNYQTDIIKSMDVLKKSTAYLEHLKMNEKNLAIILGDSYPKVSELLSKVDEIKATIIKQRASLMNVTVIEGAFQLVFSITTGVLSEIHSEMKAKESSIETLQPILDYFWEKNIPLGEQIAAEIDLMSDRTKYTLNKAMESLPAAQSLIDRAIVTLELYNEKNELLLNYPLAKTVIEDILRQKKRVSIDDLPFEPKDAEKYLRLFQNQRYREFAFDESDLQLMKKA